MESYWKVLYTATVGAPRRFTSGSGKNSIL